MWNLDGVAQYTACLEDFGKVYHRRSVNFFESIFYAEFEHDNKRFNFKHIGKVSVVFCMGGGGFSSLLHQGVFGRGWYSN